MTREDAHKILGSQEGQSEDYIKECYRSMAQKWHPDRNKDPSATERFKQLKAAYERLTGKKQPDNSMAQTMERVSGIFMAAVEGCSDPAREDLPKLIRKAIANVKRELEENIRSTYRAVDKRERILKRLRGPKDNDFLRGLLEKDIARHKLSIAELEAEVPKTEAALKLLEQYGYETDGEPPYTPTMRYLGSGLG